VPTLPRTPEAECFLVEFGQHVRRLRRDRKLSQERMGELAGVDRQTINRLENATHAINAAHLPGLARALGVTLAELMPEMPGHTGSAT
jgi:putative transcriptional regulator